MQARTNKWINRLAFGMAIVLFGHQSALAQDIKYNYLPGTDFAKYKTYVWAIISGGEQVNQITDVQIKAAVDSQLALKGFVKHEGADGDMFVGYQVAVTQSQQYNTMGTGGAGWGRYGGGWAGGVQSQTTTESTINTGELVVDFYQASDTSLIWTGTATKTVSQSSNAQKNLQSLNNGVAKLLKDFPPPVKN